MRLIKFQISYFLNYIYNYQVCLLTKYLLNVQFNMCWNVVSTAWNVQWESSMLAWNFIDKVMCSTQLGARENIYFVGTIAIPNFPQCESSSFFLKWVNMISQKYWWFSFGLKSNYILLCVVNDIFLTFIRLLKSRIQP